MRYVVASLLATGAHSEVCSIDPEHEASSLLQIPQGRQQVHEGDALPNASQFAMLQDSQYGCQGDDSRCAGADPRTCVHLVKEGAACGFVYPPGTSYVSIKHCEVAVRDIVMDGHAKVCTGNDSRCPGADQSRCQALSQEGADCLWVEDQDFFSSGRICYNHGGVVKSCKALVDDCMKNAGHQGHPGHAGTLMITEDVANLPVLANLEANITSGRRRRRSSKCTGAIIQFSAAALTMGVNVLIPMFSQMTAARAANNIVSQAPRSILVTSTFYRAQHALALGRRPSAWEKAAQLWNVMYAIVHGVGASGFIKSMRGLFSWWSWIVVGITALATLLAWYGSAGALAAAEFFTEMGFMVQQYANLMAVAGSAGNIAMYCNQTLLQLNASS